MWCLGIEHKQNKDIDTLKDVLHDYGFSKLIGGVYILSSHHDNPLAQIYTCLSEIKTLFDSSKLEIKSFQISDLNDLSSCLTTQNITTKPKTVPPKSIYDHNGEKKIALSETIFKDYDSKDLEKAYFLYTDAGVKENRVMCGYCLYSFEKGYFKEINHYKCPLKSSFSESSKAEKQAIVISMKCLQNMFKTKKLDSSYKLFVIGDNQAVINGYKCKNEGFTLKSDFTNIEYKWCKRGSDACNKVVDAIVNLRG
ncbi:hypothetical protein [Helicobacter suis]|uniref:hypothetical protein n=1 Tax=Helicobacter suis TaxID=104628 RepID=UPI001F07F6CA|nr:hypothetical protein [Helicobacter suis]